MLIIPIAIFCQSRYNAHKEITKGNGGYFFTSYPERERRWAYDFVRRTSFFGTRYRVHYRHKQEITAPPHKESGYFLNQILP